MPEFETAFHARRVEALLGSLIREEPVIAVHGPRSVGKSTLLRRFAAERGVDVVDLDDPAVRDAVEASPSLAVADKPPLCIDEYQRVPELLDALKARLNRSGEARGVAVLTGSTRHDAIPRTAQALTGRLHNMVIWPLSQGEIEGEKEDLLTALRDDPDATVMRWPSSSTSRDEYIDRICTGGFPLALARGALARSRWFDDYVRTSIERDATELAKVRQRQVLSDLLARLAGQTAQVLNVSAAAEELGVDRKTVEAYVRLLEDLFLVSRLPAWGKTLSSRVASKPKVHVVDSGLAARLLRIGPAKLRSLDPTALTEFGHLLETFAVGEIRKQVSWLGEPVTIGHWRRGDDDEVDLVVEFDDGRVLAFEVKAGERVGTRGFNSLRAIRDSLGARFIAGVVLTLGSRSYTYQDRLHVMPIDRIWRQNSEPPLTTRPEG